MKAIHFLNQIQNENLILSKYTFKSTRKVYPQGSILGLWNSYDKSFSLSFAELQTETTTSLQDSVEENAALKRRLTEVVDSVQKLESKVNETGTNVSGKCK